MTGSDLLAKAVGKAVAHKDEETLFGFIKNKKIKANHRAKFMQALSGDNSYQEGICSLCGRFTAVTPYRAGSDNFVAHGLLFGPQKRGFVCRSCLISHLFLVGLRTNNGCRLVFATGNELVVLTKNDLGLFWKEIITDPKNLDEPYILLWGRKLQDFTGRIVVGADSNFICVNTGPGQFFFVNRQAWAEHLKKKSKWKEVRQDNRISREEKMFLKGVLGWK